MRFFYTFFLLLNGICLFAQNTIQLSQFAMGFTKPLFVTHANDSRVFVVEQDGKIWFTDSLGVKYPTPFLDIDSLVKSTGNEQGLLGLAFHPDYQTNGYFFINYIKDGIGNAKDTSMLARYKVSSTNPNVADYSSRQTLLKIMQPYSNHNGGCLHFGLDGYLYMGMGDGGSAGDPQNYAQNDLSLLGKMLRLDVDVFPYAIPASNPYVGSSSILNEIWSKGLRNPWRYSFDRKTGDMWIGDVGQNVWEEIDYQAGTSIGGENYGWRCYEANVTYNTSANCPASSTLTFPAHQYQHATNGACSLTGGYVYRGNTYPTLEGQYLYCDYCSGEFWSIVPNTVSGGWTNTPAGTFSVYNYSSFGEDKYGNLYVTGLSDGKVYKVKPNCSLHVTATSINASCGQNNGSAQAIVTGGTAPYTYSWDNGNTTSSITNMGANVYDVTVTDAAGCVMNVMTYIGQTASYTVNEFITNVACKGDSSGVIDLNTTGGAFPFAYSWSTADTTIAITNQPAGNYSVTVTDANGCVVNETYTITEPSNALAINASPVNLTQVAANASGGTPPYTYSWNTGEITDSINGLCIGTSVMYWVQVTDANGCVSIDSVSCIITGINPAFGNALQSFSLSPNPTENVLKVSASFTSSQEIQLRISDILGKTYVSTHYQNVTQIEEQIEVKNYPAGIYLVSLIGKEGYVYKKWVKL